MNVNALWQVFLDTGSPEIYLLYNRARQAEGANVFKVKGSGITRDGLQ